MTRIRYIILIETLVLFLISLFVLCRLFDLNIKAKSKVKVNHIFKKYSVKTVIWIVLAALGLTALLSMISNNTLTNVMLFACIVTLIPYAIDANQTRIKQEDIFDDVIIYCQNMAMMLKQTHNVYSSMSTVVGDLSTELKEDVGHLLKAIDDGYECTQASMEMLEKNYPFTCISNLDVILCHMQFEDAHIPDELLAIYQNELEDLEKDVRDNKAKRKALRLQYALITAASLIVYYVFLSQIKGTFQAGFEDPTFHIANGLFLLVTLITLFFVDRYFNSTITKE